MKEKFIATSLFAGAIADVSTTLIGFSKGVPEGMIGMKNVIENSGVDDALILKMAVTSLIIGVYALSKQTEWERLGKSTDKAARLFNVCIWAGAALNAAYLARAFNK